MRKPSTVVLSLGLLTAVACTPNNRESERSASGSVAKSGSQPVAASDVDRPVPASGTISKPAPQATAPAATPVRSTYKDTSPSEAVFVARLRAVSERGAIIDVLTTGRLAIVDGCLVLNTVEGPALALFNSTARFDPSTGIVRQGATQVSVGQPVAVNAVPRQANDFGFLVKHPPASCPTRVISMASMRRG
jgi:hypothetical protein